MTTAMSVIWLVLTVALAILEAATTALVAIWFAVGALFAMVATLLGFGIWPQLFTFAIASALMLYFTKPILKKVYSTKRVKTNADMVVSMEGVVIEEIDNALAKGQVKLHNGQIWTARSQNEVKLESGAQIRVESISGVKVIVSKI